jgi:hypothetical protein
MTITYEMDSPGVQRLSEGNPKIVIGLAGTKHVRHIVAGYAEQNKWPHYTLDLDEKTFYMHVPLSAASTMCSDHDAEAPHRRSESYWVVLNRNSGDTLTQEEEAYVTFFIAKLAGELGVPPVVLDFPRSKQDARSSQLIIDMWEGFSGILSAALVPNSSWPNSIQLDLNALRSALGVVPVEVEEVVEELEIVFDAVTAPSAQLGEFKGRPIGVGSTGKKVSELRDAWGLDSIGLFDDELETLVLLVQEEAGLESTGSVDAATWSAIRSHLEE